MRVTIKPMFAARNLAAPMPLVSRVLAGLATLVASASVALAQPDIQRLGPAGGTPLDFAISGDGPQVVYAVSENRHTPGKPIFRIQGLPDGTLAERPGIDAISFLGLREDNLALHPTRAEVVFSGRYRSTDAGQTWEEMPGVTRVLAFNPLLHDALWARGTDGLLQSRDAGDTWHELADVDVWELAASPADTSALLARSDTTLLRSTNGGATWSEIDLPEVPRSIAVAPDDAEALFAGASGGLYHSTDAGLNWALVLDAGPVDHIEIDPSEALRIFVVAAGTIQYSADGGATWSLRQSGIEAQVAVVRIDPKDSNRLFAGAIEAGAYQSADGGATWTSVLVSSVQFSRENAHTIDPNAPERVIVNTWGRGSHVSNDGGLTWGPFDFGTPPTVVVFDFEFAPSDPSVAWAALWADGTRLLRSHDGGVTWEQLMYDNMPGPLFRRVAIHPADSDLVIIHLNVVPLRLSEDGGDTWTWLERPPGDVLDVAFVHDDRDIIFVSTHWTGWGEQRLIATWDRGATWSEIDEGYVMGRLHVPRTHDPELYVARQAPEGGLFRSGTDPIAWEKVPLAGEDAGSDFSVFDVTGNLFDPSILYVSTSHGLLASTDEGANWEVVTDAVFHQLKPDPHAPDVLWGVHRQLGLFRLAGLPVASDPSPPGAAALVLAPPYPNPTSGSATLAFQLDQSTAVTIAVYDVLGRRVAHLVDGPFSSGRHEASFSSSALAGGVYHIRMVAASEDGHTRISTQRLTVTR